MRKIIVIIGVLVLLGGAFALMSYLSQQSQAPEQKELKEIVRKVDGVKVEYTSIESEIVATGRLGAQNVVDVISEVQGEILKGSLPLKKGQSFRKGDLLVRIYDKETVLNLKAAKSRFLNGIANILPDFKMDFPGSYPTIKAFFDKIKIDEPLPDLPEIKSEQEKIFLASKNILNDYYTIKSSEVRLSKYKIRAPFNGSFTDVMLEVGAIANPGTRIARIISTNAHELEIPVEVNQVKWLKTGKEVKVSSEDGQTNWSGKIVRIADFVDPSTQSVSVFITVNPVKEKPLYEGQYLKAYFTGYTIEDAMEIPRRAVFNSNNVFVVKDSIIAKREINIIKINQESLIFNGLEPGTVVVAEPIVGAIDGNKVIVSL